MKRMSTLVVLGLCAALTVGLAATALAQRDGDHPSRAGEVPGPTMGPSGQTGDLHYFENNGTAYAGGATFVGPFRLLPPGTQFIPRPSRVQVPRTVDRSADPNKWIGTQFELSAPPGFSEASAQATLLDGTRLDSVDYLWTGVEGRVQGRITTIDDSQLPLDVYLTFDDSPIVITVQPIPGGFAVIEQPRKGPAPNVGYVNAYFAGRLLLLESPDLGQDRLLQIAQEVVSRAGSKQP